MAQNKTAAPGGAASGLSTVQPYNGPTEKILKLKKPVKLGAEDPNPVTQLLLTEPTARQLSNFLRASNKPGGDDVDAGISFIAENAGVSVQHVEQIGARDLQEALDFLGGFTPGTPPIGTI